MADVVVNIKGENRELKRSLSDSEKQLIKLSKSAKKSSEGLTGGLRSSTRAAGKLAGVMAGGLGVGLATTGFKAFSATVEDVMSKARRQAALTRSAFDSAFSGSIGFDLGGERFTLDSRKDIVAAGRLARQELNRINSDLTRNFTRLVNSGLVEGTIEKALAAGSLIGVGEDENRIFKNLTTQRDILQSQVDSFETAATKQLALTQLSQKYKNELGLISDAQKEINKAQSEAIAQAKILNDIRPSFSGPISPGGSFQTFGNFGDLPPGLPEKKDIIDPSITLELLSLQRAVDAGVIPALQGMRAEAGLLQDQLFFMLDAGVKPTNVEFQTMLASMQGLQQDSAEFGGELKNNAVEFEILSRVGSEALSGIGFQLEAVNSQAAKLRNTLRRVGNIFLDIAIKTGLQVGIGALTGNPIAVGDALRNVVGLPAKTGAANFTTPTLSTPTIQTSGVNLNSGAVGSSQLRRLSPKSNGQQLVATVSGTDLLVMLRDSQHLRGGGSISLG